MGSRPYPPENSPARARLSLLLLDCSSELSSSPPGPLQAFPKRKKDMCQPFRLGQLLRKELVDGRSKGSLCDDQWDGSC